MMLMLYMAGIGMLLGFGSLDFQHYLLSSILPALLQQAL